jgi:murein DD-endopeptidase MepM/ murein hydrolase activator NlpD
MLDYLSYFYYSFQVMKRQRKVLLSLLFAAAVLVVGIVIVLKLTKHSTPGANVVAVAVKNGDTLSSILTPQNLSGMDILEIARLLRKDAKVKNLKADSDIVKIARPSDAEPVNKIIIQSGPWKQIEFIKTDAEWSCKSVDIEKEVSFVMKSGEIRDGDSFYAAGIRAGIPESVLADAYDLLAFEMDFERDIRAGQQFSILYEENYVDGQFVNTGSVTALSFDAGNRGIIKMYRFMRSNGRSGYYDENGGGAIKSLKRTPINNAWVTSSFSGNRRHPVLGYSRAHRGVDFRAGHGTPIPAAGAGRVVQRGTSNGYGNFIRIRHNATYETLYAHMSRFQSGVGPGSSVRQGQIVGYVGSTGVVTGPHLHYEIIKNGQRVNPMTVKLPAIDNLGDADKSAFLDLRQRLDKAIDLLRSHPTLALF